MRLILADYLKRSFLVSIHQAGFGYFLCLETKKVTKENSRKER